MSQHAMGYLRVERAGPLAMLQDAGRFGTRRLGVTQGGPADLHAFAWANRLLGNAWDAAALEVSLGGLVLVAERTTRLALCGADLQASVEGEAIAPWRVVTLREGQRLSFATPVSGLRAYLAVPGGFAGEPVLGSLACVAREGLGGHAGDGRALAVGDKLDFGPDTGAPEATVPEAARLDYRRPARLALIPGAQVADFTGESLYRAFNAAWRVDARADRMGVRLRGPALNCRLPGLISEGIALGAVQVPPDGQPIALLNDRQTIGGYPRLGTLTPLACARLAQCAPGQEVQLVATPLGRAQARHRRFLEAMGAG
ncbi:biotin-dependent carboxyltransferase family protein [Halomonas denitrificans]|uniref:5-oxoprolinase subunit C family protein n=1 Tax=Halomonas denitrificans TaxID=370769 RepID=UPI000D39F4CB|nr:biotin-dependent carboxyltransferase family protein [Halomonas denitrificans]